MTATIILFLTANISAFAVETYSFNTFSDCEEVYCDVSDSGAFAFGYYGKTIRTQSFLPSVHSYSFTADGGFVSVPFLDVDTVCAVYRTDDNKYHILRINCLSGEVSNINSDVIEDFNYNDFVICNNRIYIIKTDDVYCYVSSYGFDGRRISDYSFNGLNVNEIITNNGSVYAFLYGGSVYRLDEDGAKYCTRVRDSSDFYNCGADFLADSNGYIYSLKENSEYNAMYKRNVPFAVDSENVYYSGNGYLYCCALNSDSIKRYELSGTPEKILQACGKTVVLSDDFSKATVLSDGDYKNTDFNSDKETKPTNSADKGKISDENSDNNSIQLIFTDDGLLCNIKAGTTATQLKKSCPQIINVTDKNGNDYSGKLRTGAVAVTDDKSYTISVIGDITGTGTVSSNDYKLLMQTFTGEKEIFGAYKKAADYNLDGSVDNRDLVLIAQGREG